MENALTPTFTSNPLLPPLPKFLAELLSPAEGQTEQQPRGGEPAVHYGEKHDIDRLPIGLYSFPVRGPTTPGIGDYRRLGGLKGPSFDPESRGGIPPISYGEQHDVDRLTPGYYSFPVRGTPSPSVEDYTHLGKLKGPSVPSEQLIPPHQLADDSPQ